MSREGMKMSMSFSVIGCNDGDEEIDITDAVSKPEVEYSDEFVVDLTNLPEEVVTVKFVVSY
jgi:hypothetical protein